MSEAGVWVHTHPALAAEALRAQCVVQRDHTRLQTLLAHDLRYVHATGLCHDRSEYLAYLACGPRFVSIDVDDAQVLDLGDHAQIVGRLRMQLIRTGQTKPQWAHSWLSQLWRRQPDQSWQLVLLQSTAQAQSV